MSNSFPGSHHAEAVPVNNHHQAVPDPIPEPVRVPETHEPINVEAVMDTLKSFDINEPPKPTLPPLNELPKQEIPTTTFVPPPATELPVVKPIAHVDPIPVTTEAPPPAQNSEWVNEATTVTPPIHNDQLKDSQPKDSHEKTVNESSE